MVYGRTIAETNQAADALRDQDRTGLIVGDTTTVNEWAKTWITTYKAGLRNNTLQGYRNAYNNHILPHIATMKLQDIRPIHVRQVMKAAAPYSEDLQHKILNTMRQLFTTARQNGLMLKDPTEGIKVTPHARPPKKSFLHWTNGMPLFRPWSLWKTAVPSALSRSMPLLRPAPGRGSGAAMGGHQGREADCEPGLYILE